MLSTSASDSVIVAKLGKGESFYLVYTVKKGLMRGKLTYCVLEQGMVLMSIHQLLFCPKVRQMELESHFLLEK